MPPKSNKIYKLKPTDGPLSRDDLSTWMFTVESHCIQFGWSQFLPEGPHETWLAKADNPTNGLQVIKLDGTGVDVDATRLLRNEFKHFLSTVAANCPTNFTDTVKREATSLKWIEDYIKKTYNLTTKGESFLDGLNLKFEFDDSFTHQQAWMMLKDHYISALLPSGSRCMGRTLTADETLTPLATNLLVEKWLLKIDLRLPDYVRTSRGYLFTEERPTLACNQQILCDQIDQMIHELDSRDSSSSNNVNISYVPQFNRGGRGYSRPRPFRSRGRGRGNPSPRYQEQGRRSSFSCHLCLEARRYDSSITHSASTCPFPPMRRNATRQPQSTPPFKVLLLPTNKPTQPASNTYVDNFDNPSANNVHHPPAHFPPSYGAQDHQYYEGQDYDDQYEYSTDGQYGYADTFETGTIEEL